MTTQQLVPLGIVDRPNQYGEIPPGAMSKAERVFLRKPGILTPQPVLTEWRNLRSFTSGDKVNLLAFSDVPGQATQYCLGLLDSVAFGTAYSWTDTSGSTSSAQWAELTTGAAPLLLPNRPLWVKHRTRFFILTDRGVMVQDSLKPASSTERQPRYAGINQPNVQATTSADANGIFATDKRASYTAVFRRVLADGYAITSQPWPRIDVIAPAQGNGSVSVFVPSVALVGDVLEIYRTKIVDKTVDPGPTLYLARAVTLTAGMLGGLLTTLDNTPDAGLGQELYVNPGQEGSLQDNRQPPLAANVAVFKGFTFYGNLTQPPKAQIFILSDDTFLAAANVNKRTNYIGVRTVAGTSTSGNPTITGVSAADMVGIQIGQAIVSGGGGFPAVTYVASKTASTITFSNNATASGAISVDIGDCIWYRTGGSGSYSSLRFGASIANFIQQFNSLGGFTVVADRTIPFLTGTTDQGITIGIEPTRWITAGDHSFELLATNGQNYVPTLIAPLAGPPSSGQAGSKFSPQTKANQFQWSKDQLPEACPAVNSGFCGSTNIVGFASTRDALYFFCSDGIFRLSGSAGQWRLDPVDSTITPAGPQTIGVMFDQVYCYSNNGLVRINTAGNIEYLSAPRINALQGQPYDEASTVLLVCDEGNNEVWFALTPQTGGTWWIYNAITDAFTTVARSATEVVTAVGYAEIGFNNGFGGVEFAGVNTASTQTSLKHIDTIPASWLTGIDLRFQPAYGKRSETVKQWLRATHLFSRNAATASAFFALWNGGSAGGSIAPVGASGHPDSRLTLWTPSFAAVAPAISPGLFGSSAPTADLDYLGCTLEFEELTTQQRAR